MAPVYVDVWSDPPIDYLQKAHLIEYMYIGNALYKFITININELNRSHRKYKPPSYSLFDFSQKVATTDCRHNVENSNGKLRWLCVVYLGSMM